MNKAISPANPLAALHDIHLPPPIGWWPPAIGWWLLLMLTLLCTTSLFWWLRRRRMQRQRPTSMTVKQLVTAANLELGRLAEDTGSGLAPRQAITDASRLLRRVAVQLAALRVDANANASNVAGLTGDAWLRWLDAQWDRNDFSQGAGRALIDAPYRHTLDIDPSALLPLIREWLDKQS